MTKNISYICGINSHDKIFVKAFIIDKCNYNCSYCYNKKPRTLFELDQNILIAAISAIQQASQKNIVIELIGGEPMLYSNIIQLVDVLQSFSYIENIVIYSNFSFSESIYINMLYDYSKLSFNFSWHYVDNIHNKEFIRKSKKMSLLSRNMISRMTFSIMYEPKNTYMSYAIYSLIKQMNVPVELLLVGYRKDELFIYDYSNEEKMKYYDFLHHDTLKTIYVKYDDGSDSVLSDAQLVCMNSSSLHGILSFKGWTCLAGLNRIYIDVYGNAYRCQLEHDIGLKPMYNIYLDLSKPLCNSFVVCQYAQCACEYFVEKHR